MSEPSLLLEDVAAAIGWVGTGIVWMIGLSILALPLLGAAVLTVVLVRLLKKA